MEPVQRQQAIIRLRSPELQPRESPRLHRSRGRLPRDGSERRRVLCLRSYRAPQLTESQVERFGRALRLLKVEDGVPKMFSLTCKRFTYGGKRREGKRNWAPSLMPVNKVVLRGRLGGGSSSMGLVFRWRVLDLLFSFWAGTVFSSLLYDHYASLPSTPLPRFGNREGVRCRPSI